MKFVRNILRNLLLNYLINEDETLNEENAKSHLREIGYATFPLWQANDVQSAINEDIPTEKAVDFMEEILESEGVMITINEAIEDHMVFEGYTLKN